MNPFRRLSKGLRDFQEGLRRYARELVSSPKPPKAPAPTRRRARKLDEREADLTRREKRVSRREREERAEQYRRQRREEQERPRYPYLVAGRRSVVTATNLVGRFPTESIGMAAFDAVPLPEQIKALWAVNGHRFELYVYAGRMEYAGLKPKRKRT